jgi:hypothetical protein
MKMARWKYLSALSLVFIIWVTVFVGEVLAESPTKIYENRQFRFAIIPPPGWTKEVSPPSQTETVVKFLDPSGSLTVAVRPAQDFQKKIINLISNYDLSEEQLADLANSMYGSAPGVIDPTLLITHLSSQRALGSIYAYVHRSLGAEIYIMLFKAETIRGDFFYKVEMAGPAALTLEEAIQLFTKSSELLKKHMLTFIFLPGKP